MHMKKFNYHSPQTINDCYSLFKELEAPFYLAGGMTLLPSMKQGLSSPTDLIDLTLIKEMKGIFEDQFSITVGSLTTHNEIAQSKLGNNLTVNIDDEKIDSIVIEKPFFDPKKKITSA